MKQVSIRECESYDYDILKKSFEDLISDIGPLESFIKPNSKVLIKPNLVIKKSPEEGATTHPVLVRVVCEELLKLNCKELLQSCCTFKPNFLFISLLPYLPSPTIG